MNGNTIKAYCVRTNKIKKSLGNKFNLKTVLNYFQKKIPTKSP